MNEIANYVTNANAPVKLRAKPIPTDVAHSAGGREMSRLFRMIRTRLSHRNRIDPRHLFMVGNAAGHLNRGESWETAQVAIGDVPMLNVVDVVGNEIMPPIVEDQSE